MEIQYSIPICNLWLYDLPRSCACGSWCSVEGAGGGAWMMSSPLAPPVASTRPSLDHEQHVAASACPPYILEPINKVFILLVAPLHKKRLSTTCLRGYKSSSVTLTARRDTTLTLEPYIGCWSTRLGFVSIFIARIFNAQFGLSVY